MRDQIFISYSHRDKKWLERIRLQLLPLVRSGLDVWDDTCIRIGSTWKDEIHKALSRARIGVLLVSPHFLASDFIAREELPPLLDAAERNGLVIFWIAVSASAYDSTIIAKYKAANDPRSPLDKLRRHAEINEELVIICKLIRDAYDRIGNVDVSLSMETVEIKSPSDSQSHVSISQDIDTPSLRSNSSVDLPNINVILTEKDSIIPIVERYDRLMTDYRNSLHPYLLGVFNELLQERISRLRRALAHQEIILDDKEDFIHFYIKTLRHYQNERPHFTATSLPSRSYFWDDFTLGAIRDFIKSGGKMTRIFVVDEQAASSAEAHQVMAEQSKLGVSVFTTHPRGLSRRLRSTFLMVEHGKRIGWEVHMKESTTDMEYITVTTNASRIADLETEIHHIHKLPYVPFAPSDDIR